MRHRHLFRAEAAIAAFAAASFAAPAGIAAQTTDSAAKKPVKAAVASTFFDSEQPLDLVFTTNLRQIRGDKGTVPPWRSATMSYKNSDGTPVVVPLRIRTRGIWRLKNCEFPPVRLNFSAVNAKGTIFEGLDKPKLSSYCQDNPRYEEYVVQELQLYRVYRLLTPVSHRARLLRITYTDSATGRVATTRSAFIMEDLAVVAARAGGKAFEQVGAQTGDLDPHHDAVIGVFQYMIGNTDYSINGLHNAELVQHPDGRVIPVAYDFDFSGAVNARYATVDPSLNASRVRDRLFRGFCVDAAEFSKVFALFNEKKPAIYALYEDEVGARLPRRTADETLKYFDEFYRTINDPRAAKREIIGACR